MPTLMVSAVTPGALATSAGFSVVLLPPPEASVVVVFCPDVQPAASSAAAATRTTTDLRIPFPSAGGRDTSNRRCAGSSGGAAAGDGPLVGAEVAGDDGGVVPHCGGRSLGD